MTAQYSLFEVTEQAAPIEPALPDLAARHRIENDLSTNLLVEAGAGAGKTTEMVHRMVALVRTGRTQVHQIAAVTFTRKAAAELRERFQTSLERELRKAHDDGDTVVVARLDAALREIDRAFLGTIHAFCARLLRERPLDAGLDPAFRETLGAEEIRLRREFWNLHLERLATEGDASLGQLNDVGLSPQQLTSLFEELVNQPDVEYPADQTDRPNAGFIRRRIEGIMDRAEAVLPHLEPRGGWDSLQKTLRMLKFHRWVLGWKRDARFIDILAELGVSSFKVTKNRWPDGNAARAIADEFVALFDSGGAVDILLRQWWAFRYPVALSFVRTAAASYEHERIRAGTLNFQDLLMFAARLLRESPAARRELSDRYRYILVDEFQDTDPIQAEVLFLLASDEELDMFDSGGDPDRTSLSSWRHLTPRDGALFVVGDPKQSIYRFRRADMQLYQHVRERFTSFGAVVELTANFRSCKPIETFVNSIFAERFKLDAEDVQAPFAPMQTRAEGDADAGVFWYELDDPVNGRVPFLAEQEAERVAAWIAQRIANGERRPGDFLLLTWRTRFLARYAAALEQRNIPVQVTGAGVGGPDGIELEELRVLLRALADPGDPTLTLAALVGLFFGLDYEQLVEHAGKWAPEGEPRLKPPFMFTNDWHHPETAVEAALDRLNRYWNLTRQLPADVAIGEIVDDLGVLPFAAAGELGESRAGALLFALDAVRAAALAGDASLAGAIATIDAALDEDESEAPLEPGRTDVVRVMNLHKAKGLEATVVILATPFSDSNREPASRVERDETGRALGYATVTELKQKRLVTLAQPADWEAHATEEKRFGRAEEERLLYVATTRPARELVIGCALNPRSPSPWRVFHDWLGVHGTRIVLPEPGGVAREHLDATAQDMHGAIAEAAERRGTHARPTYRVAAVTDRKGDVETVPQGVPPDDTDADAAVDGIEPRGTEWGTVVHDALRAAARGLDDGALRMACRNVLIGYNRPMSADEPVELDELMATVETVRASSVWHRSQDAQTALIEVPFAVQLTADEYAGVTGRSVRTDVPAMEVIDGRIDLVFREPDGWVIVDYKSDAAGERIPADLMRRYRGQLALYASAWARITGDPVKETMLFFTQTGMQM